MISDVMRTERGWAGHFICAAACRFRRNTLLEHDGVRVVVSTVGAMFSDRAVREIKGMKDRDGPEEIGLDRYYETMAFHANEEGPYIEADVSREVEFESSWSMGHAHIAFDSVDNAANDMHERVVDEIVARLMRGEIR